MTLFLMLLPEPKCFLIGNLFTLFNKEINHHPIPLQPIFISFSSKHNLRYAHNLKQVVCVFNIYATKMKIMVLDRYAEILEDLKKDPESHGGPPDGIVSLTIYYIKASILSCLHFC